MTSYRKAYDIAGYSYQAQLICKECARRLARRSNPDPAPVPSLRAEDELRDWARSIGLDREEEDTFDSGDFPKVVFWSEVPAGDFSCDECGESG